MLRAIASGPRVKFLLRTRRANLSPSTTDYSIASLVSRASRARATISFLMAIVSAVKPPMLQRVGLARVSTPNAIPSSGRDARSKTSLSPVGPITVPVPVAALIDKRSGLFDPSDTRVGKWLLFEQSDV